MYSICPLFWFGYSCITHCEILLTSSVWPISPAMWRRTLSPITELGRWTTSLYGTWNPENETLCVIKRGTGVYGDFLLIGYHKFVYKVLIVKTIKLIFCWFLLILCWTTFYRFIICMINYGLSLKIEVHVEGKGRGGVWWSSLWLDCLWNAIRAE